MKKGFRSELGRRVDDFLQVFQWFVVAAWVLGISVMIGIGVYSLLHG